MFENETQIRNELRSCFLILILMLAHWKLNRQSCLLCRSIPSVETPLLFSRSWTALLRQIMFFNFDLPSWWIWRLLIKLIIELNPPSPIASQLILPLPSLTPTLTPKLIFLSSKCYNEKINFSNSIRWYEVDSIFNNTSRVDSQSRYYSNWTFLFYYEHYLSRYLSIFVSFKCLINLKLRGG